ncbi:MAG: FecR family protein [Sphingobacteriaceae bacterium]
MEDNKDRLLKLFNSPYWTQEERLWLLNYLDNPDNDELYNLAFDLYTKDLSGLQNSDYDNLISKERSETILANLHDNINVQPAKVSWINSWAIAATIALAVLSAGLLFLTNDPRENLEQNTTSHKLDIAPGSDKAILTLADGSRIVLGDSIKGEITKQGNSLVINTNNVVSYNTKNPGLNSNATPAYNTITTPRGGQYKIILPDNTVVWLNAASSLRFPTAFTGNERKVELTGEAYFEVAKNKAMPFKVNAGNSQIEVLGTHFNVMAYTDEHSTNTTLIEGSVKVIKDNSEALLVPGQQAKVADKINVASADVNEAIAWKNGLFQFKEAELKTILRQISRWYDVEIEYEGKLPKEKFRAEVSREANLSQVLKILEISGVNFTIKEGRKIIVKP